MIEETLKKSFSILIIDDEPANIQMLANLLTKNNFEVEFATSGKKAMKWIGNGNFDLVLLDIMMPDMDGFEICQKLKEDSLRTLILDPWESPVAEWDNYP